MLRRDGSIQSANLPSRDTLQRDKVATDYCIYRCLITRVYFIDDEDNKTFDNKQVTYDAVILGGRKEGQVIVNIKTVNKYGGQYNYEERIFRQTTDALSGDDKVNLAEQRGDIVYVTFINGDTSCPIIIGAGVHPLDKTTTGATIEDGARYVSEYNGIYTNINSLGEYELVRKGGEYNSDGDYFIPADRSQEEEDGAETDVKFQARLKFYETKMLWQDIVSSIEFDSELITWTHVVGTDYSTISSGNSDLGEDEANPGNNKQLDQPAKDPVYKELVDGTNEKTTRVYQTGLKIEEDGANDKTTTTYKGGLTVVEDGDADKKTETFAGGLIVKEDGSSDKITKTFAGGMIIVEDGSGDKVTITTAGGLTITINGAGDEAKIETSAGDKIDIKPGDITLKENGGGEFHAAGGKVALGNGTEVLDILSQALEALNTDLGNLGYPLANSATYGSLKAQLDAIKGSL